MEQWQEIAKRLVMLPEEKKQIFRTRLEEKGINSWELPIVAYPAGNKPLSLSQRRLWFIESVEEGSDKYNMHTVLDLHGDLDHKALNNAFNRLAQRHEILVSTYHQDERDAYQQVIENVELKVQLHGWQGEALSNSVISDLAFTPFALSSEPPIRLHLFQVNPEYHKLLVVIHHIAFDDQSELIFIEELSALYNAEVTGKSAGLADLELQYSDFASWQTEWEKGSDYQTQAKYWREALSDNTEPLHLPLDYSRKTLDQRNISLSSESLTLGSPCYTRLQRLASEQDVSFYSVLLSVYALVLQRFADVDRLNIGTSVSLRSRPELAPLIGFFVNTLAIPAWSKENEPFLTYLQRVHQSVTGGLSNQNMPMDKLMELLSIKRSAYYTPLFQAFFVLLEEDISDAFTLGDLKVVRPEESEQKARFDFILKAVENKKAKSVTLQLQYAPDLFKPEKIKRILRGIESLAVLLTELPTIKLDAVSIGPTVNPFAAIQGMQTALTQFEAHAILGHSTPAIIDNKRQVSYGELNALAAQWANRFDLTPLDESPVALALPRSPELITGMIASWKAARPYLALDTSLPPQRLTQLLVQSGASLIVGLGARPEWIPSSVRWLNSAELPEQADKTLYTHKGPELHGQQLAYLIYTSGSTGTPKAVGVNQSGLTGYVNAVMPGLSLAEDARMLSLASVTADLGHTCLFGALLTGRTFVCIDDETAKDPIALTNTLSAEPVDCLKIVPSHLNALMAVAKSADLLPLQCLVLGGEGLTAGLVEKVNELKPGCRVLNHYGPTEGTIGCISGDVESLNPGLSGTLPLGRAMAGYQVLVLDRGLRQVPEGCDGELYISGPMLARGYLGDVEKTALSFIPNPFVAGARMYRTGDKVRLHAAGVVEFIGRLDHQVKVRGYRVELGEVEAWLKVQPGVGNAAVVAKEKTGRNELLAYITGKPGAEQEIRQTMLSSLPEYMVPKQIVCLSKLPLLANGKVDRRSLPQPKTHSSNAEQAAGSEVEAKFNEIWQVVLGRDDIGPEDNFFELGGDSILSLQVVAKARAAGFKLTPKQLFDEPTIAGLSALFAPAKSEPSNKTEQTTQTLMAIWQLVLGRDDIGVEDNFFELGGDSILSLQVVAKARAQGIELTPKHLFDKPNIADLTNLLAPTAMLQKDENAKKLKEIWQAVLGREDIGLEDNFFELGGDSILSLQVVAKARAHGIELTPKQLFDKPNIAALVKLFAPATEIPMDKEADKLKEIWQAVLGREDIGLEDNFFELGGDSILSLQVVAKARAAGVMLTPKQLFDQPSIAGLVKELNPAPSVVHLEDVPTSFPLLPIQEWFFSLNQPFTDHWNMSLMLSVDKQLELNVLRQAVGEILEHHPMLRAGFHRSESGWRQSIVPSYEPPVDYHDYSNQSPGETEFEDICSRAQASLELEKGRVFKLVYFDFGTEKPGRLLLIAHHLVIDGVSWRILLDDLLTAYSQLVQNQPVELIAPVTSYGQWALRLEQTTENMTAGSLDYWLSQTSEDNIGLPKATNDSAVNTLENRAELDTCLSKTETKALLEGAPSAYRTQINDLLLTALAKGLANWLQHSRVSIELEGHGRDADESADLSRTLGWFTTRFPVQLSTEQDLVASLKSIKEQLRAIPDKGLSFGLVKYLIQEEHELVQPEVSFNYLGQLDGMKREIDWVSLVDGPKGGERHLKSACPHWLDINCAVSDGQLSVNWSYCEQANTKQEIAALSQYVMDTLRALITHCSAKGNVGFTPSDFPISQIKQSQLDDLAAKYGGGQIEDIYPLVPLQQGMLFHTLKDDLSGAYFNQLALKIDGELATERFVTAWQKVIDAHSILRTAFIWQDLDEPLQVVLKQLSLPLVEKDWRDLTPNQQSHALNEYLEQDIGRGFTLDNAPLMRLALFRTEEKSWYMVWSRHHLVVDGWSSALLIDQVVNHYLTGQDITTPEISYGQYIGWLQNRDLAEAEAFWRGQMSGIEAATPLPRYDAQHLSQSPGVLRQEVVLTDVETQRLSQFAQKTKVTLNTIIQGVWALLLGKYSASQDVVFGVTTSGRPPELVGIENTLGVFINTLPLRIRWRPELLCRDYLQNIQKANVAMREHESTPLTDIQRWSGVAQGQNLFESLLVFENYPVEQDKDSASGLAVKQLESHGRTNYPITLSVEPGERLAIRLEVSASHYRQDVCDELAADLHHLIGALTGNIEAKMDSLPLLNKQEHSLLSLSWSESLAEVELDKDLVKLFEQQVALRPDSTAASFTQGRLSYRELNEKANQLANWLLVQGVGTDTLVAQCTEREPWMLVSLLAIQKAGAAYVPLDPHQPKARIQSVLNEAKPSLILVSSAAKAAVPEGLEVIELESLAAELARQGTINPSRYVNHQQLAYTLFTSGSTGKPKGVQISRGAFANHLHAMQNILRIDENDSWLAIATITFDPAGLELFLPLVQGAHVIIANKEQTLDAEALVHLMERHKVSVLHATPATWQFLVEKECSRWQGLKAISGGEALSAKLAKKLLERDVRLLNAYGPTEVTVISSAKWIKDPDITIGKAPLNNQLYVLDTNLNPVPQGVVGELYIGGLGLARGYMARVDLTAQAFIPNPFAKGTQDNTGGAGSRIYRTGDLVRSNPDGSLVYLGRRDFQVKVRGFRIELGEIEGAIEQTEEVDHAVVVDIDERLVAYVTTCIGAQLNTEELIGKLKNQLPDYMVPGLIMVLDVFPLNNNGKVDRKALPAPDFSTVQKEYQAPQTEMERQLADIWQQLLKVDRVGRTDNFFELGGHSLLATRLVSKISSQLNKKLSLKSVFEAGSLMAQADVLACSQGSELPILERVERSQAMPLSYSQQRLWIVDQLEGASTAYNMKALLNLTGELNVSALENALSTLIQRHEILRTTYIEHDDEPLQLVNSVEPFRLLVRDLSELDKQGQQHSLQADIDNEVNVPFDLADSLMLRAKLFSLGKEEHVLVLVTHHIASDDWSMQIMARELIQLYSAKVQGEAAKLAELPVQYTDFAAWQKQCLQGEYLKRTQSFWRDYMFGAPELLDLPLDFARSEKPATVGDQVVISLDLALTQELKTLAYEHQASLFMVLLAGFNLTLHREQGLEDIVLGTDLAGRTESQLESLIGFFINVLPIRTKVDGNTRFSHLLNQVKDNALQVFANQQLPFDLLVETLNPTRNKFYQPVVQSLFVMQNVAQAEVKIPGLEITPMESAGVESKFDMGIFVTEKSDGLEVNCVFKRALFKEGSAQHLMASYRHLLGQIVREPDTLLSQFDILDKRENTAMEIEKAKSKGAKLGKLKKLKPGSSVRKPTQLVQTSFLEEGKIFPVILTPSVADLDVCAWVEGNRDYINELLYKHAGILFRGFPLKTPQDFEAFANAVFPGLYGDYGDLPKKEGGKKTYKSTPYPEEQMILYHNESSHLQKWPMKQWFFSEIVAPEGGATPIVDCREMYRRMPQDILRKLEQKQLLYVRNFTKQLDVSWQDFFKTDSKEEVEQKCREEGMEFEWLGEDELQTRTLCPAVITHPISGEKSFFNQVQLHHIYCLEPEVRADLLDMVGLEMMPRNVYYGDGTPIEDKVMETIGRLYEECAVRFQWQQGDLVMVDNMLAAHARDPFKGPRKIVVAMGDMLTRTDLALVTEKQ